MDTAAWTLLFLVPSSSVATNTVELVNTTVRMTMISSGVLVVVCALMIAYILSKIESSEVTLSREHVSLAEQVGQVDSIIRSQTTEHGQSFVVRTTGIRAEYLMGDGVRLRKILLNLLSNAVKYTPAGGRVEVLLEELPDGRDNWVRLRITVSDNGCGMEPEFVRHIFEPFTRAESSVTNKVQGTGLGMAITKNIVDLIGGTISVESTPGKRWSAPLRA